jgi:2-oxoglutarate dehydrogenase complex dehydrogenase (E1) component-like enzyme
MPSTAANYFHLLRTQMRLPFRKPLVVVSPKKLLRFKGASSNIEDFEAGTAWMPLIGD